MIVRTQRKESFTVTNNKIINDERIDFDALGLLTYLLSKPDHWQINVKNLVKQKKAGEHAIRSMLKQLRDAGYVVMKKQATGGVDWLIYDEPVNVESDCENHDQAQKAILGKSQLGKIPNRENHHVYINTERPIEKTEKDLTNTEGDLFSDDKPNPQSKPDQEKTKEPEVEFETFWSTYGVKKSKETAVRAWKKLKPKDKQAAVSGIPAFFKSLPEWQQKPYPATYLNGKRWLDETEPESKPDQETQQSNHHRGVLYS